MIEKEWWESIGKLSRTSAKTSSRAPGSWWRLSRSFSMISPWIPTILSLCWEPIEYYRAISLGRWLWEQPMSGAHGRANVRAAPFLQSIQGLAALGIRKGFKFQTSSLHLYMIPTKFGCKLMDSFFTSVCHSLASHCKMFVRMQGWTNDEEEPREASWMNDLCIRKSPVPLAVFWGVHARTSASHSKRPKTISWQGISGRTKAFVSSKDQQTAMAIPSVGSCGCRPRLVINRLS